MGAFAGWPILRLHLSREDSRAASGGNFRRKVFRAQRQATERRHDFLAGFLARYSFLRDGQPCALAAARASRLAAK